MLSHHISNVYTLILKELQSILLVGLTIIKRIVFIQVFGRFMTEEECSENLDLQKEIGVIFQPGGKGQVNRSHSCNEQKRKFMKKKKKQ